MAKLRVLTNLFSSHKNRTGNEHEDRDQFKCKAGGVFLGEGVGGGGLDLLNCTLAQFNSEDWIPILGLLSLNLHGFSALFHCTSHARISPQGHANNYSAKL